MNILEAPPSYPQNLQPLSRRVIKYIVKTLNSEKAKNIICIYFYHDFFSYVTNKPILFYILKYLNMCKTLLNKVPGLIVIKLQNFHLYYTPMIKYDNIFKDLNTY